MQSVTQGRVIGPSKAPSKANLLGILRDSLMIFWICGLCFRFFKLLHADRPPTARTCPISDFLSNFACLGFKVGVLKKFLDDSAWSCLEKLKKCFFN